MFSVVTLNTSTAVIHLYQITQTACCSLTPAFVFLFARADPLVLNPTDGLALLCFHFISWHEVKKMLQTPPIVVFPQYLILRANRWPSRYGYLKLKSMSSQPQTFRNSMVPSPVTSTVFMCERTCELMKWLITNISGMLKWTILLIHVTMWPLQWYLIISNLRLLFLINENLLNKCVLALVQ